MTLIKGVAPSYLWGPPWTTQVVLVVKNPPANGFDAGSIPGLGRSLEEESHSSILVWRIPWTEHPGRLQTMGSQRGKESDTTCTHGELSKPDSGQGRHNSRVPALGSSQMVGMMPGSPVRGAAPERGPHLDWAGSNCDPRLQIHVHPEPQNVTLCASRVCAGVIS